MTVLLSASGSPILGADGLPLHAETPLIHPGRKKGLLPSSVKPGSVCGFFSELAKQRQFDIIPQRDWAEWIRKDAGNYRPYVWMILDQDGVGSCAAEDTAGNEMVRREIGGQERVALNPYGLYHYSSGGSDRGSDHPSNLRYARDIGIPSQEVWPRSKGFRASLSSEALEDAKKYRIKEFYECSSLNEMGTALLMGFTCLSGYSGHSIMAGHLLNTSQYGYPNSWGDWGDEGWGVLSFSRVMWSYGVYAVEVVTDSGD